MRLRETYHLGLIEADESFDVCDCVQMNVTIREDAVRRRGEEAGMRAQPEAGGGDWPSKKYTDVRRVCPSTEPSVDKKSR